MIKRRKFPRIFPGWMIVLTGGILALWGQGYHSYGFSALFKPIAEELGFSRAVASGAASIGRAEGGFEAPLTGWLTDKYGAKWLIFTGVFIIGLSLILMYFINSLWAFYVVWGVMLGTGANIALSLPVHTTIANWFVRKRGVALGTQWVFSGLSGVLVMPLVAWLIITQGWRTTCLIGGVVMLVVGLPLVWFFMKQRRPEYYGLLPDGAQVEEELTDTRQMLDRGVRYAAEIQEVEFTARQALRTLPFWLLMISNAVHNLVAPVMNIHLIPFLTDTGIDPLKAAGMMAIYVGASIPARFAAGLLADHIKIRYLRFVKGGAYLVQAVGIAAFLLYQTEAMIYVWFILYGIGQGAAMPVTAMMRARYYGRKAFGSLQGLSQALNTPVGVIAPIYVGWIYDTSGSYMTAFVLLAVLVAAAGIIALFIFPPKPPTRITDVDKIV